MHRVFLQLFPIIQQFFTCELNLDTNTFGITVTQALITEQLSRVTTIASVCSPTKGARGTSALKGRRGRAAGTCGQASPQLLWEDMLDRLHPPCRGANGQHLKSPRARSSERRLCAVSSLGRQRSGEVQQEIWRNKEKIDGPRFPLPRKRGICGCSFG